MKKLWLALALFTICSGWLACKAKSKKPEQEPFFPTLSYIKSQVAEVDTSLNAIKKVVYIDSVKSDTTFYKREQFRELASDFLTLPDLHDPKYKDRYVEKKSFDETLNRAMFILEPVKASEEVIQRQEVLVEPNPPNDKVTSIIIDYLTSNKDSSVEKHLLWQVGRSFRVTTIRQFPGKPEMTSSYKVIWNEEENE